MQGICTLQKYVSYSMPLLKQWQTLENSTKQGAGKCGCSLLADQVHCTLTRCCLSTEKSEQTPQQVIPAFAAGAAPTTQVNPATVVQRCRIPWCAVRAYLSRPQPQCLLQCQCEAHQPQHTHNLQAAVGTEQNKSPVRAWCRAPTEHAVLQHLKQRK